MKKKQFLRNICILTAGSIALRLIGIGFSGWLSRKIGAEGMGLFQLVFSVYSLASTIATSGIYLAVTRLVAEELGKGNERRAAGAMRVCMIYGVVVSALASGLLWFGAPFIGTKILGDSRTILSMKVLAAALPFMAFSCSLRGYFFAIREVWKTNSSQILEQLIRIAVVAATFQVVLPKGLEWACVGIALGSVGGEALTFWYTFVLYLRDRRKRMKNAGKGKGEKVAGDVLSIAVPVALSSYLKSALVTLENILIPAGFRKYGADTTQALAQYGMMEAMVMPVLSFPAALITSFSSLLVPEVAEWRATGRESEIDRLTEQTLRGTFLFSLPVATAFILFGEQLGSSIYGNAEAGRMLWVMAPLTPILYLDIVADALLKGMDQQLSVLRYSIIDSSLSVLLLYTLLPVFGLQGYITVLFFTSFVNAALSISRLTAVTRIHFKMWDWIGRPLTAAGVAGIICYFASANWTFSPVLQCIFGIGMLAAIYLASLSITAAQSLRSQFAGIHSRL